MASEKESKGSDARALNEQGMAFRNSGELEKAIDCYEKAIELDPRFADPWNNLGIAYRQQGFILPQGNPQGIRRLSDLVGDGIRFVNRQRGSGTRVLLDYLIAKNLDQCY